MAPLTSKTMPRSLLAVSARAPLALVLALLAGCGGGSPPAGDISPTGSKSGEGAADEDGFMRVGQIVPAQEAEAPAASAVASSPPPPPEEKQKNEKVPVRAAAKPNDSGAEFTDDYLPGGSTFQAGAGAPSDKKSGGVQGAVVDSQGGLSEADVRSAIAEKRGAFRRCYDLGVSGSPSFSGTVSLRVSISPAGNVAAVEVVSSNTQSQAVDTCVHDEVRKLMFPAKGSGAVVAFPIEFGK